MSHATRDIIAKQAEDFAEFANIQEFGWVHPPLAHEMIEALHMQTVLHSDTDRRLAWLTDCLAPEGFPDYLIERIDQWLIDNIEV